MKRMKLSRFEKSSHSKKFEYKDMNLIYDGMDVKSFISIYNILANQNANVWIISIIN